MSEWINNVTRRKETLKSVLRQLHEGKSVDEVKAEFRSLTSTADSAEIAEVEQMLITEGLDPSEIQRLCDVHVAVFQEALDQNQSPGTTPGNPIYTFTQENEIVGRFLTEMSATLEKFRAEGSQEALQTARHQLDLLKEFDCHYRRKEHLLFPYLERYGFEGPSKVMWGIHDEIRAKMKNLALLLENATPAASPALTAAMEDLDQAMRAMVYKEEKILFPAALEMLSLLDWLAISEQEHEIGYFLIGPGGSVPAQKAPVPPQPAADRKVETPQPDMAGQLPLDTGLLTLEQINLMLRYLPVDITYVDEHDTVRFFSQTRERIFERTPAIIGRQVQNCHPPQSVGRVQKILDDFRSGRRETAEFWIQMGPRFVHIRYFAVRDGAGCYRGTIEVTQDLAPLRALEGERRLLDD